MALQPAAGAKDLNPRQVETNRQLTERLASVFRLVRAVQLQGISLQLVSHGAAAQPAAA